MFWKIIQLYFIHWIHGNVLEGWKCHHLKFAEKMPNSIRIEEYQNAVETLEKGEVWRNRELLAGYPAHIAGDKEKWRTCNAGIYSGCSQ